MFTYPDVFKVGIAESGNHDNLSYEDDWAERYHGLLVKKNDGTTNYTGQDNAAHAKHLKGKLLLIHGMLEDTVPPQSTLLELGRAWCRESGCKYGEIAEGA